MPRSKLVRGIALSVLLLAGAAAAAPSEFQIGLAFSPALPRGEFRSALGRTVWGGELTFAFRPSRSPLLLGTRLGFGAYDADRRDSWLGLTDPDVLVNVHTVNALVTWSVFLRLQPERGPVRPYVEVFAGLNLLTTDTQVGDDGGDDDANGNFNVNNASDTAFAFGAGAGVQVPLVRFMRRSGRLGWSIDLDLGVRYTRGGRADYLIESDIPGLYDARTSRTNLLTLSGGLTVGF